MDKNGLFVKLILFIIAYAVCQPQPGTGQWDWQKTREDMANTGVNLAISGAKMTTGAEAKIPGAANYSRTVGAMQCTGEKGAGMQMYPGQSIEYSGDALCGPTCRGECLPSGGAQDRDEAFTTYRFQCKCPKNGCTPSGTPIVQEIQGQNVVDKAYLRIECAYNAACTCKGMDTSPDAYRMGYVCNSFDYNIPDNATGSGIAKEQPTTIYSVVKWCACCPMG